MFSHSNVAVPNEHHPQFSIDSQSFMVAFIAELDRRANEISSHEMFSLKYCLLDAAQNLRVANPSQVYSHLIKCMVFEQQLLYQAQFPAGSQSGEVIQSINQLSDNVRQNEDLKKEWVRKGQAIRYEYEELERQNVFELPDHSPTNEIARQLRMSSLTLQLEKLNADENVLVGNLKTVIESAQPLTKCVIDEYLKYWQWNRKHHDANLVINGANLNTIQTWCESLADSLWSTREQIRVLQLSRQQINGYQHVLQHLVTLSNAVTDTLRELIQGSFIVVNQPSQVIRTLTKFSSTLRLLVGNALKIRMNTPSVKAIVVAELQAHNGAKISEVVNGKAEIEYDEASQLLTATFPAMKLESFKRPGKKTTDNVTDEKFALRFSSSFKIGDLHVEIQTLSLPVVVISNNSQELQALTTIFWDNSFAAMDRSSFVVPEQVTWNQLAEALNKIFVSYNHRGLTQDNLHFLAEKFFNGPVPRPVPEHFTVSWSSFGKENLPNRQFSFGHWFYSALRLTKDHLRGPWEDGLVEGFISKNVIEDRLQRSAYGTFMLRFSDSELGELEFSKRKS